MRRKIPYVGKDERGIAPAVKAVVGRTRGSGHREPRITISFERPVFNRIASLAEQRGQNFATLVRDLVLQSLDKSVSPQSRVQGETGGTSGQVDAARTPARPSFGEA